MDKLVLQPYLEQACDRLRERGERVTAARARIFALLLKAGRPLAHHEVLAALAGDPLDRVTVYRVLDWLVAQGWALRQVGDDRLYRFAMATAAGAEQALAAQPHAGHGHFRCMQCHRTFCLDDWPARPQLSGHEFRRLPRGFVGEQIEFTVRGRCAQCAS
ncbi:MULTISPECIES: Fur family transcriptional regulator [Pandoraea]|uniref:Uncharacterized protein n=1 Tax=Pandoraea thiooxydans TaxID=445709 RepID=A0A0G3EVY7_9BURK|nr:MULTISPECIES: transcriptional repressor [Pandoraea]AKJ69532.1 hypothetical protein ABW99_16250 [Pandoraea thiooxydans]TAL57287.1 MAG: transcriptional repressor [Pandoraea sp.]TAM16465.1 MAG: transcriptional repressor [Pandoraea sp.]